MIENSILGNMAVEDAVVNSLHKDGEQIKTIGERNSWDKEADDRFIIHSDWAIKNEAKQVVVLSNDSNTLILMLWCIDGFMQSSLKEYGNMAIWQLAIWHKREPMHATVARMLH